MTIEGDCEMKRTYWVALLIFFFTIFSTGCDQNQSSEQPSALNQDLSEKYGLLEKCGNHAEEWFKVYQQNYPGDKLTYKNHFNTKLNKCFIYITSFQSGGYQTVSLFDVSENKKYGSCVGVIDDEEHFACAFLNKDVKSKTEWDSLVKPFMEE